MQFRMTGSQKIPLRKLQNSKMWVAVLSFLIPPFLYYFPFLLFSPVCVFLPPEDTFMTNTQELVCSTRSSLGNSPAFSAAVGVVVML